MGMKLHNISAAFPETPKMPVLFLGHGSPMNAIEENEFVKGFREIGKTIPRPTAVLCISAHWETRGTKVTAMENPRTIHDFGGFPRALFEVQYPAPGSPELADEIKNSVQHYPVESDQNWGLDHGAWSVIKHLFPAADVPVIELSLDFTKSPREHFELAGELARLRKKGVLIIGSGNMVHNLRLIAWDKMNTDNYSYDWASEANAKIKDLLKKDDFNSLIHYKTLGKEMELAVPTPEHFLPLLYTLGLKEKNETISFFNDKAVAGSLTMTSLKIDSV